MNLFQRAGIVPAPRQYKELWHVRQERIKKEGSEPFTWEVPAIAAAARASIEIARQFPLARKYMPLDYCQVTNKETAIDLTLTINGGSTIPVPAGTIITVSDKWFYEIGITNNHASSTTTLHNIIVVLMRQPDTIDAWARRQNG